LRDTVAVTDAPQIATTALDIEQVFTLESAS
jgi:hypothetical protein